MSDTADLYQSLIMDRARNPHHAGTLPDFDVEAEGDNPMCGDRVRVRLRQMSGAITALQHETRGCAICIAAADLMGDAVIGNNADAIHELSIAFDSMITSGTIPDRADFVQLRALAGVHEYRSRHRCALLPWQALRAAVATMTETSHG